MLGSITLTTWQRTQLTERLHALERYGDMTPASLLDPLGLTEPQRANLLRALVHDRFIRQHDDGRIHAGEKLLTNAHTQAHNKARRDQLMEASPLGRAMLAADTPKKG